MKSNRPPTPGELETSAPTRGPWIEILITILGVINSLCRPPHGGRGLKCRDAKKAMRESRVGPHTGAVD